LGWFNSKKEVTGIPIKLLEEFQLGKVFFLPPFGRNFKKTNLHSVILISEHTSYPFLRKIFTDF